MKPDQHKSEQMVKNSNQRAETQLSIVLQPAGLMTLIVPMFLV